MGAIFQELRLKSKFVNQLFAARDDSLLVLRDFWDFVRQSSNHRLKSDIVVNYFCR
jgi:hypothetical protein